MAELNVGRRAAPGFMVAVALMLLFVLLLPSQGVRASENVLAESINTNDANEAAGSLGALVESERLERRQSWLFDGGCWYYLRPAFDVPSSGLAGTLVTGWAKIDGRWYFFDEDGAMLTGRLFWGDHEYYLADERLGIMPDDAGYGAMVTGLVSFGPDRFYYARKSDLLFFGGDVPEGAMLKDCRFVDWGTRAGMLAFGRVDGIGRVVLEFVL